ncbi:hypothetical protein DL95DRAFT_388690, partial [Leptodontidium sp. 2 PMI_412]
MCGHTTPVHPLAPKFLCLPSTCLLQVATYSAFCILSSIREKLTSGIGICTLPYGVSPIIPRQSLQRHVLFRRET